MRQTNRCSLWRALQHILIPAIVAAAIAFFCQPVYLADGKCDFGLLALLIGIPFGIQKRRSLSSSSPAWLLQWIPMV